jgi:hypothetical protein
MTSSVTSTMTWAGLQQRATQDSPTRIGRKSNGNATNVGWKSDKKCCGWCYRAPLSSIAMMMLSGVREMSMARNNVTNVTLQLGALRRCNSQQRCNAQCCGAASLQIVLLQRCSSRCYDVATLQVATLRRCKLRCCGATARVATLLWCCNSHGCVVAAL